MAKEEKAKAKTKRPTAQKRDIQNEKKRVQNREFKSQIRTGIRSLERILSAGDSSAIQAKLNQVYSLIDKGVKHGVLKLNQAARTKSRLAAKAVAKV